MRTLNVVGHLCLALGVFAWLPPPASHAQEDSATLEQVLARYEGATRNTPTVDAELAQRLFRRGNTYSNLERFDQALEEFRQAVVADPNFAESFRNLANTYYVLEQFDRAKPAYARFIYLTRNEEPTTAVRAAVSSLAGMERQDGNYDEAFVLDLRSIALDPTDDSQIHIMGNTYNNAGQTDRAIRIYQAGIAAQPGNAFFVRTLGRLFEQEGRLEEALAQYEAAAELDPASDFYANLVEATRARLER
jgi:tetratricopeptide (TPR) repeat protein